MEPVRSNQNAAISLSTCPLNGMGAMTRSKALRPIGDNDETAVAGAVVVTHLPSYLRPSQSKSVRASVWPVCCAIVSRIPACILCCSLRGWVLQSFAGAEIHGWTSAPAHRFGATLSQRHRGPPCSNRWRALLPAIAIGWRAGTSPTATVCARGRERPTGSASGAFRRHRQEAARRPRARPRASERAHSDDRCSRRYPQDG